MNDIKVYMGDRISDENSITLLENITDTINDYTNRVKDEVDWKAKYAPVDPNNDIARDRKAETISIEDLFTRKD